MHCLRTRLHTPLLLTALGLGTLAQGSPPIDATTTDTETAVTDVQALARRAGYSAAGWLLADAQGNTAAESGGELLDRDLPPASSIKPLLALIALETGALHATDEIIPWDGTPQPGQPAWENDMALTEAMRTSSEPYFRELARRIGHDRLAQWITRVGYGNGVIGADPSRAWVDGVLRITPRQQLDFITRLHTGRLPFGDTTQTAVVAAMRWRGQSGNGVFGKTGTMFPRSGDERFGWWVGWEESPAGSRTFVLLVPLTSIDGRERRIAFADELLANTSP